MEEGGVYVMELLNNTNWNKIAKAEMSQSSLPTLKKKKRRKPRDYGTNPRAKGTNLRAKGTNPRAKGTNPRAENNFYKETKRQENFLKEL